MNPASAGFFFSVHFQLLIPHVLPLWFIGDIPDFICRYSVTNNLLIYNHFIKSILFCLRRATR
ncbi:hypothetical protein EIM33_21010 [Salmonella enterica subsp. enterica]|nr:hypothetical protein [Salmonella enterica subsp. enterica serovar Senftenberg]EAO0964891.1 hypothetical protein [Salmonella enterica]EAW1913219.1 hypothetical protein [Salmonella enterica subsp. enterica]EAA8678008.1 hypothetical protein [Salmonella enterica subsp. enterica serovar Senftenberg]EAN1023710.1 hypothetical protein [Salmonella enterica subsp. enterica serovar Senftenberg]